jgi:hypothetical protein
VLGYAEKDVSANFSSSFPSKRAVKSAPKIFRPNDVLQPNSGVFFLPLVSSGSIDVCAAAQKLPAKDQVLESL